MAIESHGPLSNKTTSFLSDLGRRITVATSDARKISFLFNEYPYHYKDSMLFASLILSVI